MKNVTRDPKAPGIISTGRRFAGAGMRASAIPLVVPRDPNVNVVVNERPSTRLG